MLKFCMTQTAVPYHLSSAYEAFLDHHFTRAAEQADKKMKFDQPTLRCFTGLSDEETQFKRCFYLKEWPCRVLGRNNRLDVSVKVLETLRNSDWSLTKSTVYLNYLVVVNSIAHLAQSLHYDFEVGGQIDHPLFHLQLTLEPIPENDLLNKDEDFYYKLRIPRGHGGVTTRIPTSDMTFTSVLYCLVADHLGAGIFKDFTDNIDSSLIDRLPLAKFDTLLTSLQKSPSHFKSSHWFAHNP